MSLMTGGQTTSVFLIPGTSVNITTAYFFAHPGPVLHRYGNGDEKSVTLLNGFVVDSESVGTIKAGKTKGACVIYTHNAFEFNIITFYAVTGECGRVSVMAIPAHDHSSIVSGGPAYGTYFSDDETVGNIT